MEKSPFLRQSTERFLFLPSTEYFMPNVSTLSIQSLNKYSSYTCLSSHNALTERSNKIHSVLCSSP